jgi:DNA-binding FrmR family transcriptional regulator
MSNGHEKSEQLRRLKIIEGHIRGIQKMIEADAYCIDVIAQAQAVQSALEKFTIGVLENHLNSCVTTALQGEDVAERQRVLGELMTVFAHSAKKKKA